MIKEAEALASKAADRLRKEFPEWQVSFEVVTGSPAWELIDAAERWEADLVIVGSQGRSAIRRLLLGSVSRKVVTDSHSSVRVARARQERANDAPPRIIIGVDGSLAAEQAIYAVGQRVWPPGTEVLLTAVDDSTPPVQISSRLPQAAEMINRHFRRREGRPHYARMGQERTECHRAEDIDFG